MDPPVTLAASVNATTPEAGGAWTRRKPLLLLRFAARRLGQVARDIDLEHVGLAPRLALIIEAEALAGVAP